MTSAQPDRVRGAGSAEPFTAVNAVRVSDFIFEQLEQAILLKEFLADQRLPSERELASMFTTSRVGVREALAKLEAKGLIERRVGAHGGTFVLPITTRARRRTQDEMARSWNDMRELLEFRAVVEPEAARWAAERIDEPALDTLAAVLEASIDPACPHEEFRSLDVRFHLGIAEQAGNAYLSSAVRTIRTKINPALDLIPFSPELQQRLHGQHSRILDALRARDGAAAREAMQAHIGHTQGSIVEKAQPARTWDTGSAEASR